MDMITWLQRPWPWYVAGPLIGLMVPVLLLAGNKTFGISSSLRHICAACFPARIPFFQYDWKKEVWNLFFAAGIVAGAAAIRMPAPYIAGRARIIRQLRNSLLPHPEQSTGPMAARHQNRDAWRPARELAPQAASQPRRGYPTIGVSICACPCRCAQVSLRKELR